MKFFRHAAAGFLVAQCNSWRFIRPGGAAGRWRLGGRSGAAFPCRAAGLRWIVAVVLAGLGVIRSYGDVTYADILLNPSRDVGHQVVLRGAFYYKNTERRSFGLKQGDHEVEVFWEQLSSAKQSLVLNQKNFSGVAVTVMGTVQRFRDARNSYYITASDVVFTGAAPGQATARQAGMALYTDILLAPERYINRVVTMKGAFDYRNTERESFELKQGDDTVEVFYEQLPEQKRALILRERSFSGGVTTVVGTVHRFSNAENSYYIMASDVVIVRTPSVARMPDAGRSSEGRSGAVAASPIPVEPKTRPALPTTPVVRERSGARAVADVERKDVYEVSRTTVLSVVCLIILLTSIWVGFDSQANRITSGKGPYSLQNGALVWVMACVLLWIIVFPYYLVRRSTVMRERGGSMPAPGAPARVPAAEPAPDSRGGVQDRPGPVGVADAGAKAGGGWYYAEHGKATGPMEEGYLHVLVKGGQLGARSTLVWRQGMDGWLFYDEAFMRKEGGPERRRIPADAPALPTPRTLAAATGLPVQGPPPGGRGRLSEHAARSVAEQQAVRREPAPAAAAEIVHPSFVKGACEHCGGHFEFSSLNRGQIIECPHCHEQTRLEQNLDVAGEQARPRQKTLPVGIRLDAGSKATAAGAPANLGEK